MATIISRAVICNVVGIIILNVLSTFGHVGTKVVFVNVVFRHGDRTMAVRTGESYPKDIYKNMTFYPDGTGQLTNKGKMRSYNFGFTLRHMYGDFLGSIYEQKAIKARSTAIIRSKMTLQLVLASLYPPAPIQIWNPYMYWQPINTIYKPIRKDGLLLPFVCPLYKKAYRDLEANKMREMAKEYKDLMEKLTELTGKNITSVFDLSLLYHTFDTQNSLELPLPDWANQLYPDSKLREAMVLQYRAYSYNKVLNRRNGGMLLHRMVRDMNAVMNGTANGLKINLFAAQDVTVAANLAALGLYNEQIPYYCSAVITELRVKGPDYFVRVLYHEGHTHEVIEMTIPGCDHLCPYDKFLELTKDVMPTKKELECDEPEEEEI